MKACYTAVVALVAALTLTSVATAGSGAAAQRIAITEIGLTSANAPRWGAVGRGAAGTFEFTPLEAGALKRDSGTETATFRLRYVMRRGSYVEIETGVTKGKGRHGSFEVTYRVEWVSAGNGHKVGTGTWRFVRGTGQYARVVGGGRAACAYHDGRWTARSEGVLTGR